MPQYTWRLVVYDPDFTNPRIIPGDAQIGEITRAEVDRFGNCLECEFEGMASTLNLTKRQIVDVEVREAGVPTWTRLFSGVVVKAGNARSMRSSKFKLAGHWKRLGEIFIEQKYTAAGKVGFMLGQILGQSKYRPAGVTTTWGASNTLIEVTTLDWGIRTHNGESGQAFMEAALEATGDAGYGAGINAKRELFFKLLGSNSQAISENDSDVEIEWRETQFEDLVTSARIWIARPPSFGEALPGFENGFTNGDDLPGVFWRRTQNNVLHQKYNATKAVAVEGLECFSKATVTPTVKANNFAGSNNVRDGSKETYASSVYNQQVATNIELLWAVTSQTLDQDIWGLEVTYAASTHADLNLFAEQLYSDGVFRGSAFLIPPSDGKRYTKRFLFESVAPPPGVTRKQKRAFLQVLGTKVNDDCRIYEIALLKFDVSAVNKIGDYHHSLGLDDVGTIYQKKTILNLTPYVTVLPKTGSPFQKAVDSMQWELRKEGFSSVIYLEEALDADIAARRALQEQVKK